MTVEKGKPAARDKEAEVAYEKRISRDEVLSSRHQVQIGDQLVDYIAAAGTIVLKEEDGKPKAGIFFVAYTREGVTEPAQRPLTFSFNGGPGSSSVWLHLGVLGPRRVLMQEDGHPLPPPYRLVDNTFSLLDRTDLVFIDPVSTGYSRAVPGEEPAQYHGYEKDIEAVGEFIRLYLTRFNRWASPKFLIGESYGTTRAAGLTGYLQGDYGVYWSSIPVCTATYGWPTTKPAT